MSEKSAVRLEMELEELQEKKRNLKKPRSVTAAIVVLIIRVLLLFGGAIIWGGLAALTGLVATIGFLGQNAELKTKTELIDKAIKETREAIIEAKEST
jgi:hypothetical protein